MSTLSDTSQGNVGWVFPPQPQTRFIEEIAGTLSGTAPIPEGQSYVDVVFGNDQPSIDWVLLGASVFSTSDDPTLNLWYGIITSKTVNGFRVYLNGVADSDNYYLSWSIRGVFGYYLSGPTTGTPGVPSSPFTVRLPDESTLTGTVVITPSDGGVGGVFTPTSISLTAAAPSGTFTYTPSAYGARSIRTTNNRGLTDPAQIGFNVAAPTYTLDGPSTGFVGTPSADFTVELFGSVSGTLTVTPDDDGDGGTFTPTTVDLTTGAPIDTFTYTPASGGTKTISTTNDGGLADPDSLPCVVSAPFDPSSVTGLKMWLKADSMSLPDGTGITSWADSSANNYDLTSGTATFKTNILNGKPVVRFNGTSNRLYTAADIGAPQPFEIFIVAKVGVGIQMLRTTSGANPVLLYLGAGGEFSIYAGSSGTGSGDRSGAFHVFNGAVQFALGYSQIDGVSDLSGAAVGSNGMGVINLMYDMTSTFYAGDIAEILIYQVEMAPADRLNITNYLRTKYGL